jgi:hypothetical protein
MFAPGELDNIILSVLVFIMETTLTEEQDCTLGSVADFVNEILPAYHKEINENQCQELSRYIIKDILQNKGEIRTAQVMDYGSGMKSFPVRLVADKLGDKGQILYELTKQGFDFLFRTKEVDDELGFEIETIRLKMLITKKNYKKAMSQSMTILAMLREKRNELRQFEQQMRSDLFSVSGEQYETVVRSVDAMLREEYELMLEIEHVLELAQTRINEENQHETPPDEKTRAAQREITVISGNVQRALEMQRALILRCDQLRKLYLTLLNDALLFNSVKRYDLEEEILKPMERFTFSDASNLIKIRSQLLAPLFLPKMKRSLNLLLFYERQQKLRENQTDDGTDEDETVDAGEKLELIRIRNETHVMVIKLLLQYAREHNEFTLGDYLEYIKSHRRFPQLTRERIVFLDMLKLYAIRDIDITKWRTEGSAHSEGIGEFNLDYCLTKCEDGLLLSIERINIDTTGERVPCDTETEGRVEIDNLTFKVEYSETDGEDTL